MVKTLLAAALRKTTGDRGLVLEQITLKRVEYTGTTAGVHHVLQRELGGRERERERHLNITLTRDQQQNANPFSFNDNDRRLQRALMPVY